MLSVFSKPFQGLKLPMLNLEAYALLLYVNTLKPFQGLKLGDP